MTFLPNIVVQHQPLVSIISRDHEGEHVFSSQCLDIQNQRRILFSPMHVVQNGSRDYSSNLRAGTLHGCARRCVVTTKDYSYELRKQSVVIVTWQ